MLEGRYGTMANSNFVVKNGLTVGALTIDAATGNIVTSGTISGDLATTSIAQNDTSIALNDTGSGSDIAVTVDGTSLFTITGSGIIPAVNSDGSTGFDLGSSSFAWRDVYVSSGSLYVNGQKVLQDDSGTIVVSADSDQNLSIQTSGSGNVELDPTGSGLISLKGTVQVQAGNNITSSDGNAITFSNSIDVDAIESRSTDTNLTLTANGTGVVYVNDGLTVTGTISGTGASVSFADNILDLNADFTSGTPSENGGIRILRGDSNAATMLYNETSDVWQIFDGTNTHDIVGADDTQTLTNKTIALGSNTVSGTTAQFNSALSDGSFATLAGTETLTNKTLTSPTISAPAITGNATGVNLTLSGDLTVNGTTTTLNTTNTVVSDALIELNNGATSNANDLGIVMERGSTGDNAFIGWDESADKFIVGTTTATGASSGDLTITTGTLVANIEGNVTGNADTASTWQTARTLSLTGAVTGSASVNGSGDVSITTTATSDPVITLTGAVTGSGTMTNLGNVSITTTATSDPVITLTGDVTGSGTMTNLGNVSFATTIAANSVALGTDTTGNYVGAGATSGNGISGSVSSEGGTFTVTSNATNANTGSTIVFRDGSGNFSAGTITASLSGNASTATTATNVTATANNATNETVYLTFVDGATGTQGIETDTGLTYNPSSNTLSTSVFSGTATNAQYADLAENYVGDMKYEAGTVVEFGGAEEVTKAAPGSPRIAGVVSTAPGFLMNTGLTGATVVAVAYTGRVPTKISGPCRKGDIMVAGPNGTATRATSEPKAGMIIGKALANFDGNSGVIEIAVGR